jgi:hypothetical protein
VEDENRKQVTVVEAAEYLGLTRGAKGRQVRGRDPHPSRRGGAHRARDPSLGVRPRRLKQARPPVWLSGVRLVTSDSHRGLKGAVAAYW